MLVEDIVDILPPANSITMALLSELELDDCNADKIEKLILQDPVLSARTLHMANSSFYGFSREINTLKQAYIILGRNTLRNLVCSISLIDQFSSNGQDDVFLKNIWNHSLYKACLVSNFDNNENDQENLFLIALFKYIGLVALCLFDKSLATKLSQKGNMNWQTLNKECEDIFNISVSDLSADILDYWKLPKNICDDIRNNTTETNSGELIDFCSLVTSALGYKASDWLIEDLLPEKTIQQFLNNENGIKNSIKQADEMFQSMICLIN